MIGKSFKEMHQDVLETSREAKQLVEEAGELMAKARVEPPDNIGQLDELMNRAHGAYLKSVAALSEFKDTVNLLKKNKTFMSEKPNVEFLQGSEKLAIMATGVNDSIESNLKLLEESLMIIKADKGIKDEPSMECSGSATKEKKKNTNQQKKCAPGCIIL